MNTEYYRQRSNIGSASHPHNVYITIHYCKYHRIFAAIYTPEAAAVPTRKTRATNMKGVAPLQIFCK